MAGDDDIVLGIDLGTTFSAMASVNRFGKPEIVMNSEGSSSPFSGWRQRTSSSSPVTTPVRPSSFG